MKRGRSAEVPRELVRRLILKHVADEEGVDLLELLDGAEVHFLDEADNDVPLDSVAVTWSKA